MASKRVARSVVNWGQFAERVHPNQREYFRAFKAKSENFVNRVHKNPESLPKIDFDFYKARIAIPGLVEEMQKGYAALNISYPTDKQNLKSSIDTESKAAAEKLTELKDVAAKMRQGAQDVIDKIDKLPSPDEMTMEMYTDYFPEQKLDPENNPTFWPHTKNYQPGPHSDAIN
ncbi:unnamed protein product [Owenia fusiformis]|uniref:ATP synthase subunit d, mitochondrial n=1 Tax=Owenia fusiformis TaxID=6347 RepID=A0A8J1UP73_OWEFU|nr:unnamed protein product [Owenia fusiformis]